MKAIMINNMSNKRKIGIKNEYLINSIQKVTIKEPTGFERGMYESQARQFIYLPMK